MVVFLRYTTNKERIRAINTIDTLVAEWDDVYKKGQLSLWVLIAIYDGKKHAGQINEYMRVATNSSFEVKEQSLYRALRRFNTMGLVHASMQESPNRGPQLKYYELTVDGEEVLRRFVALNIAPLFQPKIIQTLHTLEHKENNHERTE